MCSSNGYQTRDGDDETTLADALYLEERALGAIEETTDDAYALTFREVDLLGAEVMKFLLSMRGDTDEIVHLGIGNLHGAVTTIKARHGSEREEREVALESVKLMVTRPHKDQVGNHRNKHAYGAKTVAAEDVALGNIALKAITLQNLLSLQLCMVGIHDKPLGRLMTLGSNGIVSDYCTMIVLVHVQVSIYQQFPLYGRSR